MLTLKRAGYFKYVKGWGGRKTPPPLDQPKNGVNHFYRLYEHAYKIFRHDFDFWGLQA